MTPFQGAEQMRLGTEAFPRFEVDYQRRVFQR